MHGIPEPPGGQDDDVTCISHDTSAVSHDMHMSNASSAMTDATGT